MELITIIIPVYNVEKYLRECLDSVVDQTFPNKEVLLVDDGSTDSSGVICDEYAKRYPYIRVIHKKNGGPSLARNIGINEANGEWLIFLDADDIWNDKDCLSKLYNYATTLNLDIVRFEYQAVNENLQPIEPRSYNKTNIEGKIIDNYTLVKYGIAGEWFTVLFIFKKNIISDIRFNEQISFLEDCDFYSQIFASRSLHCGYIDEKMYSYRKLPRSISQTCNINKLRAAFRLSDAFFNSSLLTEDKRLKDLYQYNSVMMYYWTLQTLASEPYYGKISAIIKDLKLDSLHERVIKRMRNTRIERKYQIFIRPIPSVGVKILHVKDKVRAWMR